MKINICVPYRNMQDHLDNFINQFRAENATDLGLLIVEQSDDGRRFNLGKLTNIGYHLSKTINQFHNSIYMFHPVDFRPKYFSQYLDYIVKIPNNGILCLYDEINQPDTTYYKSCIYTDHAMETTNGYPNNFWGWGSEDRCFLSRIEHMKIQKSFIDFGSTIIRDRNPSPDRNLSLDIFRTIGIDDAIQDNTSKSCNLSDMMNDGLSSLTYKIQNFYDIDLNIKKVIVEL